MRFRSVGEGQLPGFSVSCALSCAFSNESCMESQFANTKADPQLYRHHLLCAVLQLSLMPENAFNVLQEQRALVPF